MLAHPDQAGPTRPRARPGPRGGRRHPARPWFAIGGIDGDRLPQVREAGADRVVVVRAITAADDPRAAAAALLAGLR
ncbi:hypothetical protein GCM10009818_15610 [Nakamurella flavida]